MDRHLGEPLAYCTLVLCLTALIVLFAGTPDLHDALMAWLRTCPK